jgi:hypothetical protein
MKLEDLQPDATIRGILPDAAVTVVSVNWHGSDALTLVYRDPSGRVAERASRPEGGCSRCARSARHPGVPMGRARS